MIAGLLAKEDTKKSAWVQEKLAEIPDVDIIYIHPKNRSGLNLGGRKAHKTTYEELTDTDNWLTINNILSNKTLILLENPSRYPKISSEKIRYLRRLTMQAPHRMLVDIVPFTLAIEYVYTPMAFLGREILGFAHYYAFRENYHELQEDGTIKKAHDFDVLGPKIATVYDIDYREFVNPNRNVLQTTITDAELAEYNALRDKLFEADMPGPKIVTRLADLAHAFESRLQSALELVAELEGKTLVLTNLTSYAKSFQAMCKKAGLKNVTATSYQMAQPFDVQNCVYLEAPIVKSYYLLDVESWLPDSCKVWHVKSDAKVDIYLNGLLESELNAINCLTKEIHRARYGD